MKGLTSHFYLEEVTKAVLACGKPYSKKDEAFLRDRYIKTKYKVYKINREKLKIRKKKGFSFSQLSDLEQAKIWSSIFKNTDYLSVGELAIAHFKSFQGKKNHLLIQYWPELKRWVSKIENWVHGDMLASLYCDMLSEDRDLVYPEIVKWSLSRSAWKNRMAILSLLLYYNPKRNLLPFDQIISIVEPHLKKNHYYLQKAIGWNLRELSRAYPREYWEFINSHLLDLSPVAFTTAVEKIQKEKKEQLKHMRKAARFDGKS